MPIPTDDFLAMREMIVTALDDARATAATWKQVDGGEWEARHFEGLAEGYEGALRMLDLMTAKANPQ